jgi:hypothetical protein
VILGYKRVYTWDVAAASNQTMKMTRLLSVCILVLPLVAQIQFPGSGGPFPGGGRTGGPNSGGRGGNAPGRKTPGRDNKKEAPPVITTTGMLRVIAGNQIVLEADDHRIITYTLGPKPEILKDAKPAELKAFSIADHVSVDAFSDDAGYFTATGVTFHSAGTAQEKIAAERTWDLPRLSAAPKTSGNSGNRDADDERPTLRRGAPDPKPKTDAVAATSPPADDSPADNRPTTQVRPADAAPDADDPGRPQLRRGKPAPRMTAGNDTAEPERPATSTSATSTSAATTAVQPPPAIVPIQEDPILVKARAAAAEYSGVLPNFFCRQVTTRYDSEDPKSGWQAHDTITADLTYENGAESYKNIKVGNQSKNSMEEAGGNWSTGEFSSLVDELFDPGTAATFRRIGQDTIQGRPAISFKYEVTRERSRLRVMVAGQLYYPAYRGTIWVDRETARVLRLESETRSVPPLFPLSKVERAIDYDFVRLATSQRSLLPTNAEVLSCEQSSRRCSRNKIEFRNYRKFGAESDITFDQKQ